MFPKISLSKISSVVRTKSQKAFSYLKMQAPLASDTVEISQRVITPPKTEKALKYFLNRKIPTETIFRDDVSKGIYDLVKKARSGDENALAQISRVKEAVDNSSQECNIDFNNEILNRLAVLYRRTCRTFKFNQPLEYNPLDYHRIYRTIGQSEYDALMKGVHIVSPECENLEVFVTNKPSGYFGGKQMPKGHYFVTFKDKDNFDLFLSKCFSFNEHSVPNVRSFNQENAEYLLTGGYNIDDVETIKAGTEGKILYKSK